MRTAKVLPSLDNGLVHLALAVTLASGCGGEVRLKTTEDAKPRVSESGSQNQNKSRPQSGTSFELGVPELTSSAFVGSDEGWFAVPRLSALLHTTNGGTSWEKLPSAVVTKNARISFINQTLGWCVNTSEGAGQVWRTTDGGKNWTRTATIRKDGAEPFPSPIQLKFVDESHGWLIETFGVWRTNDGGVSWDEVLSTDDPRVTGQPGRGFFSNESQAWVCGGKGQLYITSNGGKTWEVSTIADDSEFSDIFFVDEHTGWISRNSRGQLYRTDDGGRSWRLQPALAQDLYIDSCFFLSKDEGWGVGQQLLEGGRGLLPSEYIAKGLVQAVLLHTVDGGKTWQPQFVKRDEPLFTGLHFSDSEHGWLLSVRGLYRTTDGGRSWQVVLADVSGG